MKNIMKRSLEPSELECLEKNFRLTTRASSDRKGSIHAVNMLDTQTCASYLDEVAAIIHAPSRKTAASQFSKRYSYLIVVPGLYSLTVYNKGLDLSIENSHIESVSDDRNWLPNIRLMDLQITEPEEKKRSLWRDKVLKTVFADNISKTWHSISKAGSISSSVLWENTAIYVYWLYEKRMEQEANPEVKLRIQDDFEYLIREAPASLFGEKENPLAKYFGLKPLTSIQDIRIRKTCCYYYQLSSNGDYCSTCPKMRSCDSQ